MTKQYISAITYLLLLAGLFYNQDANAHPHQREPAVFSAEQITAQNFANTIRGSAAIAGIGDWILSNGTLCASFSAPEHETYLSYRGGTLVDLGFCGRNDDQWNTYHELFNLSRDKVLPAIAIHPEIDKTSAAIIVTGKISGIENETRYEMNLEHPAQLSIVTRLTRTTIANTGESDALYLFGSLILHPHRSLTPFVLSTQNPFYSKGFQHPYADTNDKMGMMKTMFPADLHILVGADHIQPEITYGVQALSAEFIDSKGKSTALRQFAINDQDFTLLGNFTNPLWLETDKKPGIAQFAQTLVMDLKVGESLLIKKRIIVSPKANVASITDQLYDGNIIHGKTNSAENRILVTDNNDNPLTFVKPDQQGFFTFRLPNNIAAARLILNTPDHDAIKKITLANNREQIVTLESKPTSAILQLPKKYTMRLVFKGIKQTPDPVFYADASNFRVGDKRFDRDISSNSIALAGVDADIDSVSLPAGDYMVYATRGPEFSLSKARLHLNEQERATLNIDEPVRSIATPEWISADFHVHSEFSFDSTLPIDQRIREFVAQGGEIIVSSEHKRTVNYEPFIRKLHLQEKIHAITGVELTGMSHTTTTPRTIGHSNVFPVIEKSHEFYGGTLPHENRRLGQVINAYKKQNTDVVFQLNHPRSRNIPDDDINFFDHLSINKKYNPALPFDDEENKSLIETHPGSRYRDIDFDAMELLNGSDLGAYSLVRKDWFSLLQQGYRKTATANSDSHDARHLVALPRNYVHVKNDKLDAFDEAEFIQSIHNGNVFGSTGPMLDVHLEQTGMGQTYHGNSGKLYVAVNASPWINVNRLLVYLNGHIWREQAIRGPGVYEVPMIFNKNSFVTVEIYGSPGEDYQAVYPGFIPQAFSNPVYVETTIGRN